eukprot:c10295_g1_i1.p1 GENE.c10295_g1_i1~~c10295_g1_i1.p1  ORF type:complete len:609 (-),score=157.89 c10295_g1_i1:480-2141(-)
MFLSPPPPPPDTRMESWQPLSEEWVDELWSNEPLTAWSPVVLPWERANLIQPPPSVLSAPTSRKGAFDGNNNISNSSLSTTSSHPQRKNRILSIRRESQIAKADLQMDDVPEELDSPHMTIQSRNSLHTELLLRAQQEDHGQAEFLTVFCVREVEDGMFFSPSKANFDAVSTEFLIRAIHNPAGLSLDQKRDLISMIQKLTPDLNRAYHIHALHTHKQYRIRTSSENQTEDNVLVSKYALTPNGSSPPVPLHKECFDDFTLTNPHSFAVQFSIVSPLFGALGKGNSSGTWQVTCSPNEGEVKPGGSCTVNVVMKSREHVSVRDAVCVTITESGLTHSHYLTVRFDTDRAVFGVHPTHIPQVSMRRNHLNFEIPAVLEELHRAMQAQSVFTKLNVFRQTCDVREVEALKHQLNCGVTLRQCNDVHCLPTLIKMFFRELPTPILAPLDLEDLSKITTEEEALGVVQKLPQWAGNLLLWLSNVLSHVVALRDVNGMSEKALAAVLAPNLFSPEALAPVSFVKVTAAVVNFLSLLIVTARRRSLIGATPNALEDDDE